MKELIMQFVKYIFVGGAAFVADAGLLWFLGKYIHYLIAGAIAFIFGLVINFILSKIFVFKEKQQNTALEFIAYAVIGVIGLGLTELLMYIFTEKAGLYYMLSKIITAAAVLVWNFCARKFILYRGKEK